MGISNLPALVYYSNSKRVVGPTSLTLDFPIRIRITSKVVQQRVQDLKESNFETSFLLEPKYLNFRTKFF